MKRILASAVLAGAGLLASGTASASDVAWSVSIGSHGPVGVAIGVPAVVVPPPAVVYAPPPRVHYYEPAPRVHYRAPRVVAQPVALPYYGHPWYAVEPVHRHKPRGHWKHHRHHHRH